MVKFIRDKAPLSSTDGSLLERENIREGWEIAPMYFIHIIGIKPVGALALNRAGSDVNTST